MNELKDQIDKIIRSSAQKSFGDNAEPLCNGWERLHTPTLRKDLMQLIETYTTRKELEARLDELSGLSVGIDDLCNLEWKERINQLSTELINKKKEQ